MTFKSLILTLPFLLFASGCTPESETQQQQLSQDSPPAGDEDKIESFAAATEKIVQLRNVIRDGFAADDVDAAHGPLHDVGDVLEGLAPLAEKEGLSEEQMKTVTATVDTLMDAFGAVDKTLHGGEGSTYDEEADTIDVAVNVLAEIAGVDAGEGTADKSAAGDETPDAQPVEPSDVLEPEPVPAPGATEEK